MLHGKDDTKNLVDARAQGYEPATVNDLPRGFMGDVFKFGDTIDAIRQGDLVHNPGRVHLLDSWCHPYHVACTVSTQTPIQGEQVERPAWKADANVYLGIAFPLFHYHAVYEP